MTGFMPPEDYLAEYDRAIENYDIVLGRDDLTAEERETAQTNRDQTAASRAEAAERLAQATDPTQGG